MQVWNLLHALGGNTGRKNSRSAHHRTTLSGYIFATKACIDNRKKFVKQQYLPRCLRSTVNFGPLAAKICSGVWGTPANFKGFRVLAALVHGTLAVGVSQTLWRWTEGATYIRQGGHHVGHWPHSSVITDNHWWWYCWGFTDNKSYDFMFFHVMLTYLYYYFRAYD